MSDPPWPFTGARPSMMRSTLSVANLPPFRFANRVRSGGRIRRWLARGPSPFANGPWQLAQYVLNRAAPSNPTTDSAACEPDSVGRAGSADQARTPAMTRQVSRAIVHLLGQAPGGCLRHEHRAGRVAYHALRVAPDETIAQAVVAVSRQDDEVDALGPGGLDDAVPRGPEEHARGHADVPEVLLHEAGDLGLGGRALDGVGNPHQAPGRLDPRLVPTDLSLASREQSRQGKGPARSQREVGGHE